jgi:glutathione S-transferase
MEPPVLWQFRFSHFNEKARWALDWKRVPHVRRSLLPGFHMPRVLWMTGQKSVPVLVVGGRTITDSTKIIAALEELQAEPPLYPRDPVARRRALELEDWFDEELGPHLRRWAFHELLPHTDFAAGAMAVMWAPATQRIYRALFPLIRIAMKADMRIDAAGARRGHEQTLRALDRIETELQPSGYLVGDAFSVADLTAAALFAPLVAPPEFPYTPAVPMPEPFAGFRASLAERPAFRWVQDVYRKHRGVSAAVREEPPLAAGTTPTAASSRAA